MANIQDVGIEILENHPRNLYLFFGPEYGIKMRYVDILAENYGSKIEVSSIEAVLNMMKTKRVFPLKPAVYVVRYDEEFISSLTESVVNDIKRVKVIGTIVGIYSKDSQYTKAVKLLPDNTVSVQPVDSKFLISYLQKDFPGLSNRIYELASKYGTDYNSAINICRSLKHVPDSELSRLQDSELLHSLGIGTAITEHQWKYAIAAKHVSALYKLLDMEDDQLDSVYYTILSTMLELDKLLSGRNSDFKMFKKKWTTKDVYYMFMHTYREIERSRSVLAVDIKDSLSYLFSLLSFSSVPSLEVLK